MNGIDPNSPVPLYHQIAQLIRARIQGGELAPGDILEPLREAAAEWQVNFHTVRHAYAELARDGLVETRGPRGTHVIGTGGKALQTRQKSVQTFVAETLRSAQDDFGLSARQLAEHLEEASTTSASPRAYVLECSEHQCEDLAHQIESSWDVEAVPWCFDRKEDLPRQDLVATHFHYNEIRLRWPDRLAEAFFVPISPPPSLRSEIEGRLGGTKNFTLTLCEWDEPTAEAVAADLSVLLPANDFPLRTQVIDSDTSFEDIDGDLLLLPPRLWGSLSAGERNNSRLVEIRYLYDPRELEETARRLGWTAKA